jgi:predicted phosphoribosyltransferase
VYRNRKEAGKQLAKKLKKLQDEGKITVPVVVALPRGGVPVGAEIAKELNAPFDIFFVKKIPSPFDREFAIGSISENGIMFLNQELVKDYNIDEEYLQEKGKKIIQEIARLRDEYKHEPVMLEGKDVILVDDGIATGASMYLAAQSIAREMPKSITIAAPVAPNNKEILDMLKSVSNYLEILQLPDNFMCVSRWYKDFHQLDDEEVKEILDSFK